MKKNIHILLSIIFIIILTGCSLKDTKPEQNERIIGVKIYNIEGDKRALFKEWLNIGINTVFTNLDLADEEFRILAKKNDIKIYLILPIFYNPDTLHNNPDLYAITSNGKPAINEWVEFVCPSRENYRKDKIEYIKGVIKQYKPDGISLDFVRHFVFWEKVYPDMDPDLITNTCYDKNCLEKFKRESKIVIPEILNEIPEIAEWINKNCLEEWTSWKCKLITDIVRDISKEARQIDPDIKVNLHAVPWRKGDFNNAIKVVAGQNFEDLSKYTDIISPMTYSHMLKRKPEWISSVVADIASQIRCKIIPSIQVNKAYLNTTFEVDEFKQAVKESLKPPSSGIIFWSWEQLDAQSDKKNALKNLL